MHASAFPQIQGSQLVSISLATTLNTTNWLGFPIRRPLSHCVIARYPKIIADFHVLHRVDMDIMTLMLLALR